MAMNRTWNKGIVLFTLSILLASSSWIAPAIHGSPTSFAYSAPGGTSVYVDQALFTSTVPSAMVLGKSYTAVVYIVNNGTNEVSGYVIFAYPQFYFYTDQPTVTFNLAPGASEYFDFRYVASNPYSGKGMNVSAILDVNNGSKLVAEDSATVTVYSIVHSRVVDAVWFTIIGVCIVLGSSYAILSVYMKKKRITSDSTGKDDIHGQANAIVN
jgi:hypothetical protein